MQVFDHGFTEIGVGDVAQFQYRLCLKMKKALYVPISKEEFKKSQKGRKKQHHLIGPHV